MNREQAKQLLPIITAFAEGKEIQIKSSLDDAWREIGNNNGDIGFCDVPANYRIKPEPRKFWVRGFYAFENEERAVCAHLSDTKIIPVIEIL